MASQNNFSIRQAARNDLPAIYELMADSGMFGEFEADTCLVAENDAELLGFIRLETVECQTYIRPIVVSHKHQGKGIGQALIQQAMNNHISLVAIARGDAVGFYTRLGFCPISWDQIHSPFIAECKTCPDIHQCRPVPMMLSIN